jgi:hypothetical protein
LYIFMEDYNLICYHFQHITNEEKGTPLTKHYLLAAGSSTLLLIFSLWWICPNVPAGPIAPAAEIALNNAESSLPESLAVEEPAYSKGVQAEEPMFTLLTGLIFSTSGAPVAGVLVSPPAGWGEAAISDDAGHYQLAFNTRTARNHHDITYQREGFRERRLSMQLNAQNLSVLMLEDVLLEPLGPVVQLAGLIRDNKGALIVGEAVHLYSPVLAVRLQARSDEHGEFKFSQVYAATDYRLWIYTQGPYLDYETTRLKLDGESTYLEIVLEPSTSTSLEGRMVDTEGYGVPNQSLLLESGQAQAKAFSITGDARGYFSADSVPHGVLTLSSSVAPYIEVDGIEPGVEGKEFVEVVLDLGEEILEGRVINSYGNAVVGAEVRMDWLQSYGQLRSRSRRFRMTDESGSFSFNELGSGPRHIGVKAPGFIDAGVELEAHSTWLEIQLDEK